MQIIVHVNVLCPFLQTDDKGVFCTTLSQEYYLAAKTFSLDPEQLFSMSQRAIDYIFAGEDVKQKLRAMWNDARRTLFCDS